MIIIIILTAASEVIPYSRGAADLSDKINSTKCMPFGKAIHENKKATIRLAWTS